MKQPKTSDFVLINEDMWSTVTSQDGKKKKKQQKNGETRANI